MTHTHTHTHTHTSIAKRLQSVLGCVGISLQDLSPQAQSCVHGVAGCAVALETKDCSDTRCTTTLSVFTLPKQGKGED